MHSRLGQDIEYPIDDAMHDLVARLSWQDDIGLVVDLGMLAEELRDDGVEEHVAIG